MGAHCNIFLGHEHILGTELLALLSTTMIQIPCGHMQYVPNQAPLIINKGVPISLMDLPLVAANCSVHDPSQHGDWKAPADIIRLLSPEICHAVCIFFM